jgi:hypothetical protein
VTIYNEDGSVWYSFHNTVNDPDYWRYNKQSGFAPFAEISEGEVILRLVGESPHWYKVEVNEETRATKYVLKSDPKWAKKDWSFFLAAMRYFDFIGEHPPLLDNLDGKVIKEAADLRYSQFRFLKADGDWTLVEGKSCEKLYRG